MGCRIYQEHLCRHGRRGKGPGHRPRLDRSRELGARHCRSVRYRRGRRYIQLYLFQRSCSQVTAAPVPGAGRRSCRAELEAGTRQRSSPGAISSPVTCPSGPTASARSQHPQDHALARPTAADPVYHGELRALYLLSSHHGRNRSSSVQAFAHAPSASTAGSTHKHCSKSPPPNPAKSEFRAIIVGTRSGGTTPTTAALLSPPDLVPLPLPTNNIYHCGNPIPAGPCALTPTTNTNQRRQPSPAGPCTLTSPTTNTRVNPSFGARAGTRSGE